LPGNLRRNRTVSTKPSRAEISREEAAAEVLSIWEEQSPSLRSAMNQLANDWQISDWKATGKFEPPFTVLSSKQFDG
jgi:hypothetical protein